MAASGSKHALVLQDDPTFAAPATQLQSENRMDVTAGSQFAMLGGPHLHPVTAGLQPRVLVVGGAVPHSLVCAVVYAVLKF